MQAPQNCKQAMSTNRSICTSKLPSKMPWSSCSPPSRQQQW